jgi:hypothetical protein
MVSGGALALIASWAASAGPPATGPAPARASSSPSAPASAVPEIRFGVIEPPVVAQRDITNLCLPGEGEVKDKPLECSGIGWAAGQLLLTSDRHGHAIFTCPIDLETMTIGRPQRHTVILNEQDTLEDGQALAVRTGADGTAWVYVMCSMSNDQHELPLPKRRHLLRFRLGGGGEALAIDRATVINAGKLRDDLNVQFDAVGINPYRCYCDEFLGADKNTYRWGNVEGIAFTPDGSRLLCGMRNPLHKGKALLLAVRNVDQALDARDPGRLEVTDLLALNLGGRGISDLSWDARTKGYLISAAKSNGPKLDRDHPYPPNSLDSALFWWSGGKPDRPVLVATVPDMKIEAICRLGDSPYIAIGSDESDVGEGRPEPHQSVLTILEFTGVGARGRPPKGGQAP